MLQPLKKEGLKLGLKALHTPHPPAGRSCQVLKVLKFSFFLVKRDPTLSNLKNLRPDLKIQL